MSAGFEIEAIDPPGGLDFVLGGKRPQLWCLGDIVILSHRLLGIISARQIDSDLALKSSQLLKQLSSVKEVSFIGGWHSPLEAEALRILLAQAASIIFCVSKSLNQFTPSVEIKNRINQEQALLLTHCSPKAKRISRDASLRRNQLVVGLAGVLLVLSAPEGSASFKLAKSALRREKPVLTLEHRMNKELLVSNALPATVENIQTALSQTL